MLAVFGLVFYFLPKMVEFAEGLGSELPPVVLLCFEILGVATNPWVVLAVVQNLLLFAFLYKQLLKREHFRHKHDLVLLQLPVLGDVLLCFCTLQLVSGLQSLLSCGCQLLPSLSLLKPTLGNHYLQASVDATIRRIQYDGSTLGESLSSAQAFPPIACQLIAVGEESGSLEKVLENIRAIFQERFEQQLTIITSLIEPAVLLFLGISVGGITMLFFLPMMKVISDL